MRNLTFLLALTLLACDPNTPDNTTSDPQPAPVYHDVAGAPSVGALSGCNPDTRWKLWLDGKWSPTQWQHWGSLWFHEYTAIGGTATYWFEATLRTPTEVQFIQYWYFDDNRARAYKSGGTAKCVCGHVAVCEGTAGMLFPAQ